MNYSIKTELLQLAYPRYAERKEFYDARFDEVAKGYEEIFGNADGIRFFSAPGRIEIGGNHTDHQHGCVLAASIDLDVLGCAVNNNTNVVRVLSEGYDMLEVDISDLSVIKEEENTTKALFRGIYARLNQLGYAPKGVNIYCISNVLKGSGLSSSAAFEVFVGTVLNGLFCNNELSRVEIAQIGQYAENVYFGKPSGLMDQMASSVGNIVAIDFLDTQKPVVEKVDFDFPSVDHSICIIDSGADHADLTDEYTAIPVEMNQVANVFGKEYLRLVEESALLANLPKVREACGDRATLRALHFIEENKKAIEEAKLLKEGDFKSFLSLVKASGYSSYMYLQNVYVSGAIKHQEVALGLCLCQQLLGDQGAYRVHGGGFAGTLQAFVPNTMVAEFKETMEAVMGKDSCHILSIRGVGGLEFLQEEK